MKKLLAFFILSASLCGVAQQFTKRSFSVNEGLPSSQVYDIVQDTVRNIWISTDVGVSKYDGYVFKNYTQADGLADNTIVKLYLGKDGSILFQGFSKKLSFYANGELQPFEKNEELLNLLNTNNIASIHYESMSNFRIGLSVSCKEKTQYIEWNKGVLSQYKTEVSGINVVSSTEWSATYCPKNHVTLAEVPLENSIEIPSPQSVLKANHSTFFFSQNNIYKLASKKLQQTQIGATISRGICIDRQSDLWVGTFGKGVFIYPKSDITMAPIHILDGENISCIFQDEDGGMWLGSMSKGLWHINNPRLQSFDLLAGQSVQHLSMANDAFFAIGQNGMVQKITFNSWNNFNVNTMVSSSSIVDVFEEKGQAHVLTESPEIESPKGIKTYPGQGIAQCQGERVNERWIGKIYSFSKYVDQIEVFNSIELNFQERVNCLHFTQGNLYLGTLNGLYVYDGSTINHFEKTKDIRIEDITSQEGKILFASRGSGLGILHGSEIEFITTENELASNFCNRIEVVNNSEYWVATIKGLSIIKNGMVRQINLEDGLPSLEINDFIVTKNTLFAATNAGMSVYRLDQIQNSKASLYTEITEVKSQHSIVLPKSSLGYNSNQIKINFIARDYRINSPIEYRYRLLPEKNWSVTKQPSVTYSALNAGDYVFEVMAKNTNGMWADKSTTFEFVIEKPIWSRWWFLLLVTLLIGAFIALIVKNREQQIKVKSAAANELNALKIKALSSQMNPHFIFNSLNSIQNFLIDSDLRKSNKYLTMFAKLMRLVLNNSNETFVSMKEVIDSLELYMELERLRFNEKFTYQISVDQSIDLEQTEIPSMLMQPFVENSILHGILPKEGKGKIELYVEKLNEKCLRCTITDDGVGRDFYKDKKSTTHKSHGLKITEERLAVFKSYFKSEFRFDIHDLKTEDGESKGTQVELILPFRSRPS
ncbi:MAG: histidine kinase [Flavobacteriales bacterium]|nr:histidine kinase [Flavobacteriales bacterium]